MRLSLLIFTEIAKLNTRELFCNHQIVKLDTSKFLFFSNRKIKYPRNLISLRYLFYKMKVSGAVAVIYKFQPPYAL